MRHLTLGEVVELHRRLLEQSGGASGPRDLGLLQSALAQPHATFGGTDLHPTLIEKAAALGFALVANHPFVDGNKRVGHAAMEVFLALNGLEIDASVEEQERVVLEVASGGLALPHADRTDSVRRARGALLHEAAPRLLAARSQRNVNCTVTVMITGVGTPFISVGMNSHWRTASRAA